MTMAEVDVDEAIALAEASGWHLRSAESRLFPGDQPDAPTRRLVHVWLQRSGQAESVVLGGTGASHVEAVRAALGMVG